MTSSPYPIVKKWRKNNKDKVNAQARRYRAKHPEKIKAIKKKYRDTHLDEVRIRDAQAKRNWRLENPEAYYAWKKRISEERLKKLEELAGRPRPQNCELCGLTTKLVFDHCHKNGHFRGWICDRCNRVLGSVNDDLQLLEQMIDYLRRSNVKVKYKSKKLTSK